uniref:Ncn-orf2 n=1 Tax=Streptomyces arenae TaxID=29301 RepID=Q9F0J4_STRAE|nr:Ncn-orf2 [Streptomyces arenae]
MTYTRHASDTGFRRTGGRSRCSPTSSGSRMPAWQPDGLPPGWLARPAAGLPAGDGTARVTPEGLVVAPPGTDPAHPRTPVRRPAPSAPLGHLRWAAFAGTATPPGFTLPDTGLLTAHMELAAEVYGPGADRPTAAGIADTRHGMGGMLCVDLGSGLVLDFLLTNDRVWVLYERLGRPGAGHGTFTYEVPVAERSPGRRHRCAIRVDRARGTAVWLLDGTEVFAVPDLGRRLPSRAAHITRSADGPEESVRPGRLALGIGLFGELAEGSGVRLTVRRATVTRSTPGTS